MAKLIGSQVSWGRGCSCCNSQGFNKMMTWKIRRSIRAREKKQWQRSIV